MKLQENIFYRKHVFVFKPGQSNVGAFFVDNCGTSEYSLQRVSDWMPVRSLFPILKIESENHGMS